MNDSAPPTTRDNISTEVIDFQYIDGSFSLSLYLISLRSAVFPAPEYPPIRIPLRGPNPLLMKIDLWKRE